MNEMLEMEEMKIPKKPILKREDRIYIEDGKVSVHKKKEFRLENGQVIIQYYVEKTNMNIDEYYKYMIEKEE
jgi:hypothetical protein